MLEKKVAEVPLELGVAIVCDLDSSIFSEGMYSCNFAKVKKPLILGVQPLQILAVKGCVQLAPWAKSLNPSRGGRFLPHAFMQTRTRWDAPWGPGFLPWSWGARLWDEQRLAEASTMPTQVVPMWPITAPCSRAGVFEKRSAALGLFQSTADAETLA